MSLKISHEPFIWIHLAGIALLPLCLILTWLGFAVGNPLSFYWLELLLVAAIGIIPVFWMQWHRPFDIFSILIVSLQPEQMTNEQRQILSLFKTKKQKAIAIVAAIIMLALLWFVYQQAPLAKVAVDFLPSSRLLGLSIASVAFLLGNLFLQVPLSVLGVLLAREKTITALTPMETEQVLLQFTVPGFRVKKILQLKT